MTKMNNTEWMKPGVICMHGPELKVTIVRVNKSSVRISFYGRLDETLFATVRKDSLTKIEG